MSVARAAAGARAALDGLGLAVSEPTVRKTYLQMALALLGATVLLYALGGYGVYELTNDNAAWWWLLIRVAAWLLVLLAAPVIALFTVHALFPLFSERVFLAGLQARRPELAEGLVAGEGLPLLESIGISLRRLARYLGLTVLIFFLSLVPVIGALVGPPLQLLLSARMLGGELLDPYLSMKSFGWTQQRDYLVSHRPALIGFGLPWSLVFAIPLVGALVFGLAQAAAAVLVADVLEGESQPAEKPA